PVQGSFQGGDVEFDRADLGRVGAVGRVGVLEADLGGRAGPEAVAGGGVDRQALGEGDHRGLQGRGGDAFGGFVLGDGEGRVYPGGGEGFGVGRGEAEFGVEDEFAAAADVGEGGAHRRGFARQLVADRGDRDFAFQRAVGRVGEEGDFRLAGG